MFYFYNYINGICIIDGKIRPVPRAGPGLNIKSSGPYRPKRA